jgi:single-strand DNA-binding protein
MIRLTVIGHLGQDALKKVVNGKSVLSFSVARNEQFKNLQGVVQERTTWINCSYWERDNLAPYLRKGTLVFAEGRPAFRTYTDQQGEAVTGINMLVTGLSLLSSAKDKQVERVPGENEIDEQEHHEGNDLPF